MLVSTLMPVLPELLGHCQAVALGEGELVPCHSPVRLQPDCPRNLCPGHARKAKTPNAYCWSYDRDVVAALNTCAADGLSIT